MTSELKPGPWLAIHESIGAKPPEVDARPLGSFIEGYAETIPDNTALQYFDRDISYRELNESANRLANVLISLGVGLGDVVGLHMPNVPQYVIAVIAMFKLGATGTGVSPLLAPAEVANQLEDANVGVLISLDTLAKPTLETLDRQGRLPKCLTTVVVTGVDDLRDAAGLELPEVAGLACHTYLELMADASPKFSQVDLPEDHVCLIQYTGGTTGKPKGAMLALGPIMIHLSMLHIFRPWEVGVETVASPFPLFHVGGLMGVLSALRYGARSLLILDARDLDHFCQQMVNFPPTRLQAVPTLYQAIADHPLSAQIDFSRLKHAQTGSAPITGDSRKRIEQMLQGTVLADCFGLTESGPTILANPPERCRPRVCDNSFCFGNVVF